jgi:hypothetical protein
MARTKHPVAIPLPRSWFESWHDSTEFFCTAWEQIKPDTGHAPLQHLRDAYVAGLFAKILSYHSRCEVKLSREQEEFLDARLSFASGPDEFPTAQLLKRENRYIVDIEIVTADKYLRPTWRELRDLTENYKQHEYPPPTDCPKKRRDALLEAIPRVVKQKAECHYNPSPHLVVYLMIAPPPTASYPLVTVEEMEQSTEPYKGDFKSIWILREMENIRLWPERKILRVPPCQDPFDCPRSAS